MLETSGELLRERRERAGLTQRELAERSGVSLSTIERVETGTKPHSQTVRRLAKALGCSCAALLGREFDETIKVESIVPFDPQWGLGDII